MRKNWRWILGFGIILVFILSYVHANSLYQSPRVETYKEHEWIQANYLRLSFDECRILDESQVRSEMGIELSEEELEDDEMRIILITMRVENVSEQDAKFIPVELIATAYGWANGMSRDLFFAANNEYEIQLNIHAKETKEFVIPYCIYRSQLSKKHWSALNSSDIRIVVSEYPVRIEVEI